VNGHCNLHKIFRSLVDWHVQRRYWARASRLMLGPNANYFFLCTWCPAEVWSWDGIERPVPTYSLANSNTPVPLRCPVYFIFSAGSLQGGMAWAGVQSHSCGLVGWLASCGYVVVLYPRGAAFVSPPLPVDYAYEPSLARALLAHERAVRRGPDPV
jgi:hypothetical protein